MKHFAYTLAVAGMVGAMGTFAAAQSDVDATTTTCADFMAMSAEDQRAALDTLNSADASAGAGASASTDGMDADEDISGDDDAATSMSEDTVSDPVSDSHDADTSTDTEAATTDLNAEAEADESADASEDPEVQAVITACEGNEDALVADQMTSM